MEKMNREGNKNIFALPMREANIYTYGNAEKMVWEESGHKRN